MQNCKNEGGNPWDCASQINALIDQASKTGETGVVYKLLNNPEMTVEEAMEELNREKGTALLLAGGLTGGYFAAPSIYPVTSSIFIFFLAKRLITSYS